MIAIVDYGMGNLNSVAKALRFLGAQVKVTSAPKEIAQAKALVFPGVGAFGEAMEELRKRRLIPTLIGSIQEKKPFLGLCLGLQLLLESSEESPGVKGLGVIPGRVKRLPSRAGLKVPHMGWNQIHRVRSKNFLRASSSPLRIPWNLLRGVPEGAFMYFVHSFYADPQGKRFILAETEYGTRFASVLWDGGCLWATQFHPEKSQRFGIRILKNFLEVVGRC